MVLIKYTIVWTVYAWAYTVMVFVTRCMQVRSQKSDGGFAQLGVCESTRGYTLAWCPTQHSTRSPSKACCLDKVDKLVGPYHMV